MWFRVCKLQTLMAMARRAGEIPRERKRERERERERDRELEAVVLQRRSMLV
jgi:hypothetical protein